MQFDSTQLNWTQLDSIQCNSILHCHSQHCHKLHQWKWLPEPHVAEGVNERVDKQGRKKVQFPVSVWRWWICCPGGKALRCQSRGLVLELVLAVGSSGSSSFQPQDPIITQWSFKVHLKAGDNPCFSVLRLFGWKRGEEKPWRKQLTEAERLPQGYWAHIAGSWMYRWECLLEILAWVLHLGLLCSLPFHTTNTHSGAFFKASVDVRTCVWTSAACFL